MERAAGIEPASSAWKAEVIPLYDARKAARTLLPATLTNLVEGGGFEPPKPKQQIYSLPPLTTREPLQKLEAAYFE